MEPKSFLREFPKKMFIASLNRWIAKLIHQISKQTKRYGGGRQHTACTAEHIHAVWALVLSQNFRSGAHITIPQISKETDISRRKWRQLFSELCIFYMLESSKFVCSNLNKHNFESCW